MKSFHKRYNLKDKRGETLVEVLLAIGVFAIVGTAIALLVAGSFKSSLLGGTRTLALAYERESYEAVKSIGKNTYNQLKSGTYGLSHTTGVWALTDTPDTNGIFTRSVTIFDVNRDASGNIVTTGGSPDIYTRGVTITVTWPVGGVTKKISETEYFTDWNSVNSTQISGNFGGGIFNTTKLSTLKDSPPAGSVALTTANSKFWKCASLQGVTDFPGTTQGLGIVTYGKYAYMALKHNSTGEVAVINKDKTDAANYLSIVRTVDLGNKDATAIALSSDGAYAYVGTSDGNFVTINTSTFSVKTLAVSNGQKINKIVLYGTNAYIAAQTAGGKNAGVDFYSVNLASESTPALFTTGGKGAAKLGAGPNTISLVMSADGNYAFVVTDDVSQRLMVVDVRNPSTPSLNTSMNLSNISSSAVPTDVAIYQSNLYVVTSNSAGSAGEFFKIDVSSSTAPTQALYLSLGNGALSVAAEGTNALIGTQTANKNTLQVVDTAPVDNDGNLLVDQNGKPIAVIVLSINLSKFSYNSLFWDATDKLLYAATSDQNAEFQIVNRSGKINWGCMIQEKVLNTSGNNAGLSVSALTTGTSTDLYIGQTKNNSKPEIWIYDVTDPSAPQIPVSPPTNFEVGSAINDIALSGHFAFLATDDNSAQLQVFDIATSSTLVPVSGGVWSPSGINTPATAVAVNGSNVLVTIGSTLYKLSVDANGRLTYSGLTSTPIAGAASKIVFYNDGLHAYITTASNNKQVQVVQYDTNPSNANFVPNVTSSISLGSNGNGTGLWLKGKYLLVGTDNSAGNNFFVFDIGAIPPPSAPASYTSAVGTLNLGAKVTTIAAASDENFAFAGVSINGQEMKTIDLTGLTTTTTCTSGATICVSAVENTLNGFVNDMYFYNNNIFLGTNDTNGEAYIYGEIPGFAGFNTQFATNGTYIEFPPTNAGSNVNWNSIAWAYDTSSCSASSAQNAKIKMLVRSSSSSADLDPSNLTLPFTGPDPNNPSTPYIYQTGSLLGPGNDNHQYIQYEALLSGDSTCTPFLTSVTFNYTP
ncbi:MAG: hypothetical protein PHV42_03280 [Candidatus Pacebacteria bacterium]|nr:hypothetical protein [Candidatus Paceibacterota bacterium]